MTFPSDLDPRTLVHDSWWPWRVGTVIKRGKATAAVQWSDGEVWRYDRDHLQFLVAHSERSNRATRIEKARKGAGR
jgi:hypothetical protein